MKQVWFAAAALALASACASAPDAITAPPAVIPAALETDAMTGAGDRADDPAIWVNPLDPAGSLILGTNKEEGLYVYGLDGRERARLPVGRLNNVDLRGGLAVATNDQVNALSWFTVSPAGVAHLGDTPVEAVEPYGVCAGRVGAEMRVAVTYKDGSVEIRGVEAPAGGAPLAPVLARVKLASQVEGCVIDDAAGRMFVGEEAVGVWAVDLAAPEAPPVLIDRVGGPGGLAADVEGVSLWTGPDGEGVLVASAQARDRFILYDRAPPHAPLGAVTIGAAGAIDAVTHTDGLDVASAPLPGFPRGLMVVQDDRNPRSGVDQNFKLVDWAAIEAAIVRPAP